MRSRYLTFVLAVVVMGFSGVASGETILYDHFEGTTLDATKWNLMSGTDVAVAGSVLTVGSTTPGVPTRVESTSAWGVGAGNSIEFEIGAGAVFTTGLQLFGSFEQSPGTSGAHVRNDNAPGGIVSPSSFTFFVFTSGYATVYNSTTTFALAPSDVFRIDYLATGTDLYRNDVLLDSTSIVVTGLQAARVYSGSEGGPLNMERIGGGQPVPEPSTLALFATGLISLLAYAWRKRR